MGLLLVQHLRTIPLTSRSGGETDLRRRKRPNLKSVFSVAVRSFLLMLLRHATQRNGSRRGATP